jgi:hypothetical protein
VPVTKPSPFIVFCIVSNTINVYCPWTQYFLSYF